MYISKSGAGSYILGQYRPIPQEDLVGKLPCPGICSSRLNDRFAVQDSTNCLIRVGTPSCCGANDRSNAREQIGSPLGTESTCNFAVCGCGPQFPLAAIVIRWNVRMLQKGEKVAAHLAVTFAQPLAVLVGGG